MGNRFKIDANAYKLSVNAYDKSVSNINTSVVVDRMKECSELIIDDYVDRLESIGKLLEKYVELVHKDKDDFCTIADEIVSQERKWAKEISSN